MDKGSEKIVIRNESSKNSFNVRDEMLKDSKDLLDSVEVTTIAAECQKLKALEDQIAAAEENLKDLKLKADDVGSRVIPE